MESVGLERVVQTVGVLQAVVLRAFGPHGGQVLFTRDTGHLMLSRDGVRVLNALRLDHPLARMIVECATGHSALTGDGSKSFILLLASLVQTVEDAARMEKCAPHSLARELLSFSLQQLDPLIASAILPHSEHIIWTDLSAASSSPVQKLLSGFFHTRLSHAHCNSVSDLLCQFLSHWTAEVDQSCSCLQFIDDTWPALYTPVIGFPISYSRLLEGQIIHRDFAVPYSQTTAQPVKAIVVTTPLQPKFMETGLALETGDKGSFVHFSSFWESSVECVVSYLQSIGVSLLLSSVKQTDAVLGLATNSQINVVECVEQEELTLFMHLSEATAVTDFWDIQAKHVVSLDFCKPVLLGAHRYIHVAFPAKAPVRPCSLVVCGTGEGQSEQHASAMRDAIKMLKTTWEPPSSAPPPNTSCTPPPDHYCPRGCVLTSGGAFEILLSLALQHSPISKRAHVVPRILADALLCLPRHIYSHQPRRFAQMQYTVLQCVQERLTSPAHLQSNMNLKCCAWGLGLESVFCKYQLVLAVLQCFSQLLTLDSVIHTKSRLKTMENISCQEEDED
ncbi:unnamed protein product [Knipowitschia caucasica]